MIRFLSVGRSTGLGLALLASIFVSGNSSLTLAQTQSSQDSSPTPRPLLDELNRETQSLFKQTAPGIVRLHLPVSGPLASDDDPLRKWNSRLDPEVRQRLEELVLRDQGRMFVREDIIPATSPTDDASGGAATQPHEIVMQLGEFAPNSIGVILDDQGHVLVPGYVAKEDFPDAIPALLGDGRIVAAKLVGSDEPTQLTVLQLTDTSAAVSPGFGNEIPQLGTLMMVMSLNPGLNRLAIWPGWEPDVSVLVTLDGHIAGFAAAGGFIPAHRCQSIAQQLIQFGQVKRAMLGVIIGPVPADDPQRKSDPALADAPALRIHGVLANSPAQQAGLLPGDLILQLGDEPVGDVQNFAAIIAERRGKTDLLILRNGQESTVSVDLQVQ
jgi:S1-C subfamily serine protease